MTSTSDRPLEGGAGWYGYAALPLACWLVYWLALFPGIISRDSVNQWGQIVTGRYDDWHPVFHTATLWLLTRLGHSLGMVSLVQVLATAVLMGRLFQVMRRLGAPRALVWGGVAWLSASPAVGAGVIAVWKDNAFGLALLWTVLLLLELVDRRNVTPGCGVTLGIALGLMCMFRHNGHLVAIPTVVVAAWYWWHELRREIVLAAVVAVAVVTLAIGVARAMHIPHAPPLVKQQGFIHQVAALVSAGTPMSSTEREVIERLAPMSEWKSGYQCEAVGAFLYRPGMRQQLDLERWELPAVWLHLATRNPRAVARHWVCVTRYLWFPSSKLIVGPLDRGQTVAANSYGLEMTPWIPWLTDPLLRMLAVSLRPGSSLRVLFWQPALSLYVLLVSLVLWVWASGSVAPAVILAPAIFNTALWLAMSTEPHFRFQWPVVLLAPVAVCLPTLRQRVPRARRAALDAPLAGPPHVASVTSG